MVIYMEFLEDQSNHSIWGYMSPIHSATLLAILSVSRAK
jgi:hypothetical protein